MESHYQFSDTEFEQQFEKATLPPQLFNHEAHIRLAWIHITKYGIDDAINNVTTQLKAYTRKLGAEDKYHETVTIAAVRAVYHFVLKSKEETFPAFIEENQRLVTNFKDLLAAHYGIDLFNSEMARSTYLEPDILPFD